MSEFLTLHAKRRAQTGKGAARRLRAAGQVPAVFYTAKGDSIPIEVNDREVRKVYESVGRTTVFNVEIDMDGTPNVQPALIWDVDYYPTKNRFQHLDLFGVDLDKEIRVHVPLEFIGTAKGTKEGGVLDIYRQAIDVASKPLSLPQKIQVDVSGIGLNEALHVADIALPEGVRAEYDTNFSVVGVITPAAEEETTAEGAEATAAAGAAAPAAGSAPAATAAGAAASKPAAGK